MIRRPRALAARVVRSAARRVSRRRVPAGTGSWVPGRVQVRSGAMSYQVYVPPSLGRGRVPLVVLLHGCGQSAAEFAAASRFGELADQHGFVVACPQQSVWRHHRRCWRWFEAAHQQRGAGEPELIAEIAATVVAETQRWRVDPAGVYVAGLSAGGGMALILAATYPDVFAAAGVHSAPAYRSAATSALALRAMAGRTTAPPPGDDDRAIAPTIVVQGSSDTTVRPVNGTAITDQWLAYAVNAGVPTGRARSRTVRAADGRVSTVTVWSGGTDRRALELWQIDGLAHAWSGGAPGLAFSAPGGPSASAVMWDFFARKRLRSG